MTDTTQPNPDVLENVLVCMEKLTSDIKEIQKKGITTTKYFDGFPSDFHSHLRFIRLSLDVLDENVSEVTTENLFQSEQGGTMQ